MTPDVLVFFHGFARWAYGWINDFARLVDALPVSYAFGAGMLAAVNPCGFIMLPSFAAFYLTADGATAMPDAGSVRATRLGRALAMGVFVTLAFIATFGAAGILITIGGHALMRVAGWAGAAVGVALVALALYQLATRRALFAHVTSGVRVRRRASAQGVLAFGIAYAVASLGCTLPIFMLVVGGGSSRAVRSDHPSGGSCSTRWAWASSSPRSRSASPPCARRRHASCPAPSRSSSRAATRYCSSQASTWSGTTS